MGRSGNVKQHGWRRDVAWHGNLIKLIEATLFLGWKSDAGEEGMEGACRAENAGITSVQASSVKSLVVSRVTKCGAFLAHWGRFITAKTSSSCGKRGQTLRHIGASGKPEKN